MSYLNDSFLSDGDAGNATVPPAPAAGEQLPAPAKTGIVRLPGGITMPATTFYVVVIAVLALAWYLYTQNKSKKSTKE